MALIGIEVVSAEQSVFSGFAQMVFAPASEGEVGIAYGHAPLLTRLSPGQIRLQLEGEKEMQSFYISGGILEVQPHLVSILADTALRAADIDEAAALAAKEEAEKRLSSQLSRAELATLRASLAEASAQLAMLKKLRKS